ncbi:UNVERIFIED_CONTAM: putative GPI-anchored protein [Sesamum calycinum]|uniref:GPI-anchored protein n=1 Tax=Sesamum calycinum TaxID=2727403 RepID=A0AAW2QK14_9LAMI
MLSSDWFFSFARLSVLNNRKKKVNSLNVIIEGSLRSKITFSLDFPLKFDKEDNLLQGINQYRASLNLTALTKNDRAGCLADEIADQFKNQPCTNTTGLVLSNFTKSQYSGYLNGTQYTGIGVGSEDNWIVVVLTTSTPEGDYSPGSNTDNGAASLTTAAKAVSCDWIKTNVVVTNNPVTRTFFRFSIISSERIVTEISWANILT